MDDIALLLENLGKLLLVIVQQRRVGDYYERHVQAKGIEDTARAWRNQRKLDIKVNNMAHRHG